MFVDIDNISVWRNDALPLLSQVNDCEMISLNKL